MSKYVPDKWVVLRLTSKETGKTIDKVLAGWYGGYTGSDSWQLNSGIVKVDDRMDRFEFSGSSGSLYVCYKPCYGFSGLMANMLSHWEKSWSDKLSIEVLEEYDVRSKCE